MNKEERKALNDITAASAIASDMNGRTQFDELIDALQNVKDFVGCLTSGKKVTKSQAEALLADINKLEQVSASNRLENHNAIINILCCSILQTADNAELLTKEDKSEIWETIDKFVKSIYGKTYDPKISEALFKEVEEEINKRLKQRYKDLD